MPIHVTFPRLYVCPACGRTRRLVSALYKVIATFDDDDEKDANSKNDGKEK